MQRRLRQHNGELKGGARSTRRNAGNWEFLAVITCNEFTKQNALSFEWHIRYPTNKKPRPKEYQGPTGRLKSIPNVLTNDKFKDYKFYVSIHNDFDISKLLADHSNCELIPQGEMLLKSVHGGSLLS